MTLPTNDKNVAPPVRWWRGEVWKLRSWWIALVKGHGRHRRPEHP
jgi:hypothetical protein